MADSAPDTTQASTAEADRIQPYVDNAKETIKPILEEPEMDGFLREHIQKIPEWDEWSEAARQAYAHMMTSQMLQRKAMTTQITIGQAFKLPDYSAIKNLGLLLRRQPLPPPPKKKRKRPVAVEADTPVTEGAEPTNETPDMATQASAALDANLAQVSAPDTAASPEVTAAETPNTEPDAKEKTDA